MNLTAEIFNLPPIPEEAQSSENSTTSHEEVAIDWKSSLHRGMNANTAQSIARDKAWANFCEEVRAHCPETNWVFINPDFIKNTENDFYLLEEWIRNLVASPLWPFPETIIFITGSKEDHFDFRIAIPKSKGFLTAISSHLNFSVEKWEDKHSRGYNIKFEKAFIIDREGNA